MLTGRRDELSCAFLHDVDRIKPYETPIFREEPNLSRCGLWLDIGRVEQQPSSILRGQRKPLHHQKLFYCVFHRSTTLIPN